MPSAAAGNAVAGLREAAAAGSVPRVADELLALFEQVAGLPDKVQWVNGQLAADLGGPPDAALARACAAVATAIDAQPATFDRHGYHNRQHFCEVALTAYGLCQLHGLRAQATQFLLLAAWVHDVVHEGRQQPAFVQERASVQSMQPLLEAAGLDESQIGRLMVMVLATDHASGTPFMSAACRGQAAALAVPAGAPELAALLADAELAELARLLCEADVLPSIGLGAEHAMRLQDRLAQEWHRPLGRRDKLAFMDLVLAQGYIGDVFLPRVHATRAALSGGGHAVAQG